MQGGGANAPSTYRGTVAIDEYGQRMGAGLYFYSIRTENISETKKMILLK